jgi:flagellum-specific ATP synthase
MVGITLEAVGCRAPVGARCQIDSTGSRPVEAEVVGFSGERLLLMPVADMVGVLPGARVRPRASVTQLGVGEGLLGRVLDGRGRPLDGAGPLDIAELAPLAGVRRNPLDRPPIGDVLDVGVRAINALLSVGRGQRMGLFAPAGVGKSVLLGMMTRFTGADVVVVGLIGERGREVKEFIDHNLGADGLARSVVVAAPADTAPLLRVQGAAVATTIAEYFRDRGQHVLLLMDSLTRYAQALREIGLAIGEPPATRGFPPSVFARIPQLVERAGTGAGGGTITAFYTVLTEGDPEMDPISEGSRAILDGHLILSRRLAESGRYPAIDIEASISRAMSQVTTAEHARAARRFRQIYATYQHHRDLINVGAYHRGSNPEVDRAIDYHPRLVAFLSQGMEQRVDFAASVHDLRGLLET